MSRSYFWQAIAFIFLFFLLAFWCYSKIIIKKTCGQKSEFVPQCTISQNYRYEKKTDIFLRVKKLKKVFYASL